MTKKIILIFTVFAIFSCGNDSDSNNIYKTKGGEYASKKGSFIIKFPTEPNYSAINNQIGLDKFQIHLFRSTIGPNKIFNLEYVDYPEYTIKSMSNEQLFNQSVNNYVNKMVESFSLEYQKPIELNGLKGYSFQLKLNNNAKAKGLKGFIIGRLFRHKNRVYTITYVGVDDRRVSDFVNSFRLMK